MENQNNDIITNKKNKAITIILSIIIVILTVLCVLFATDTISINKQETPTPNQNVNNSCPNIEEGDYEDEYTQITETVVIISKADMNIVEKLNGYWGNKEEGLFISVDKDELSFTSALYASDGGDYGKIANTKVLGDNIFEFEVFSGGCKGPGCLDEKEDETLYFKIEIKEDKKTIEYENVIYEYLGEKWNTDYFEE